MGKTRGVHETTPELRNRMVGMYEAGLGLREIAAAVNCSQRTVKRWLNRFEKEGTVETRERCGRKRATTSEQDEAIVRLATQTPITAAKAVLPALGLNCSVDTIRERLHKAGIHNWNPSRKHIQKIPLGEADGAAIQQAVWRPTGTQLGKKKKCKTNEKRKAADSGIRQRILLRKAKSKNRSIEAYGSSVESSKEPEPIDSFNFPPSQVLPPSQEEHPPTQLPPLSVLSNNEIQSSSIMNNQSGFDIGLNLMGPSQSMYNHSNIDVTQNWSLDLDETPHQYSRNQPNSMTLDQPAPENHLHDLNAQQEQNQLVQQNEFNNLHIHEQQNQSIDHFFDQPQNQSLQVQQPQLQSLDTETIKKAKKIIRTDSCSNSSNYTDNQSSDGNEVNKNNSESHDEERTNGNYRHKKKKKGGKAKGTLETSVEIRNRMIGMAEAGLSTLSIALAINRSERTVKRWLERWNKEGNVLTKERKGRRRITTKEQDDAIVAMATQHPLTAAKHVAPALGLKCSVDTIRERLHKAGIHSWKLGKKQGEGNAVHTVHLWQPSGNRPNKSKLSEEKRKKSPVEKKSCTTAVKRSLSKKKTDEASRSVPHTENILPDSNPVQYHDTRPMTNYSTAPNGTVQSIHMPVVQPLVPINGGCVSQASSGSQQPIQQPLVPIVQQRPDCRMAPPINNQMNSIVNYSSCMVGNNNHLDQPESLNYEPFIWTF